MDEPRFKVWVADHEYWREQIKCQYACPVHTDARGESRVNGGAGYYDPRGFSYTSHDR